MGNEETEIVIFIMFTLHGPVTSTVTGAWNYSGKGGRQKVNAKYLDLMRGNLPSPCISIASE